MSHKAALALGDWLPQVINAAKPFVSSEDIDKGKRWSLELEKELDESDFGIIILTADNIDRPWLNFEAGALSKKMGKNKTNVCPLLLNIDHSDLNENSPFKQFQAVKIEKTDFLRLLKSIYNALDEKTITESQLEKSFDKWWSDIEVQFNDIIDKFNEKESNNNNKREITKQEIILEELLGLTRSIYEIILVKEDRDKAVAYPIKELGFPTDPVKFAKYITKLFENKR